jgi:hypothetical protein
VSAGIVDIYVVVVQSIKVAGAGVMDIDDVWSFIDKA